MEPFLGTLVGSTPPSSATTSRGCRVPFVRFGGSRPPCPPITVLPAHGNRIRTRPIEPWGAQFMRIGRHRGPPREGAIHLEGTCGRRERRGLVGLVDTHIHAEEAAATKNSERGVPVSAASGASQACRRRPSQTNRPETVAGPSIEWGRFFYSQTDNPRSSKRARCGGAGRKARLRAFRGRGMVNGGSSVTASERRAEPVTTDRAVFHGLRLALEAQGRLILGAQVVSRQLCSIDYEEHRPSTADPHRSIEFGYGAGLYAYQAFCARLTKPSPPMRGF